MLVTQREARSIAVEHGDANQSIREIAASYRAHGYTFSPTNLGRPPLVPLAFIPVASKSPAAVLLWQERRKAKMLRLGLTEVAHSLVFGLLAG